MPTKFFTLQEAADYLGVTQNTIRNYVDRKKLRLFKALGRSYVLKTEVEKLKKPQPITKNGRKDKQ